MGTIHVIYDPKDKIQYPSSAASSGLSIGISVAVLHVPDQMSDELIEHMTAQLVRMVLQADPDFREVDEPEVGDPIWEAIDDGGGQACNIRGVLQTLDERGYKIVPK